MDLPIFMFLMLEARHLIPSSALHPSLHIPSFGPLHVSLLTIISHTCAGVAAARSGAGANLKGASAGGVERAVQPC